MKKSIILLLPVVLFTSCLKDKPIKLDYAGYTPAPLNDGWTISGPQAENVDTSMLNKAFELIYKDDRFAMANSLLVIRNGKLIAEAYPKSTDDRSRTNNLQSITKSFTSLLTGIAIHDGLIRSVNDSLYKYIPEAFDDDLQKRKISLRNCLTMEAGIDFENSENTEQLYHCKGSSAGFVLSFPMNYDTGEIYHYNDGVPHLVGAVVAKQSGMSLSSYAGSKLFNPIGITNYRWEAADDGLNFGAFALYLTPRDLGKVGKLLVQQGNWNGTQLIDTAWIRQATSVQSGNTEPYGYYFWLYPSLKGYCMLGHGGQVLYVCEEKNLVVVYTAYPYTNSILWDEPMQLAELIFKAAK